MIAISSLPPLPVAGPLAVAGVLLAIGRKLPPRVPDIIAIATAVAAAWICIIMVAHAGSHPLVYWFGGWFLHQGQVIGISFVVDQAGASVAVFVGILMASTLLFAWGYFDEVHAHFHVLMLLFMAGMIGYCLTRDLFNMFVWFEVMSVAAFALTGYQLRSAALEGALNFTVVNTIGSYLLLGGIGLIYARFGALDMTALGVGVARAPRDPVTEAAFALMATGLLIKAAQVPFHFWLPDAHSVAPSPVSVMFSGSMVTLGLFGLARLFFCIFSADREITEVAHRLLLGMGIASAVIGALVALAQRHLKRLLAFSTISHAGIMLIGFALLTRSGGAGMLIYLVGHGLVKASLFMVVGILLATRGGVDEIGLRGLGAGIRPAGLAMALAGLLLAGLPIGLMHDGSNLLSSADHESGCAWIELIILLATACTGGAVLRAAGRIFLGLGPVAGEEAHSPTDEEQEKADRPLWLMMLPVTLLLAAALLLGAPSTPFAWRAATAFMHPDAQFILGGNAPAVARTGTVTNTPPASGSSWLPWSSTALALILAGISLSRHRWPRAMGEASKHLIGPMQTWMNALHSGLLADYVVWIMIGLALFAGGFALI